MAYPSGLPVMAESTTERDGGIDPVRASNGLLKVRRLYSAEKSVFNVVHYLSDAQRTALEAAYQADKLLNFSFTWPGDGVTYTVRYGRAPQYRKEPGYTVASVLLLEV
jgi:ABC-type branched-subunit amino acid transport system substrate-binding protein